MARPVLRVERLFRAARSLLAASVIPLAACSSPQRPATSTSNSSAAKPAIPACVDASASAAAQDIRDAAAAFQASIESGPLFAISLSRTTVTSCRLEIDAGTVSLDYQFGDGSSLRAERDASIESTNQETRVSSAPPEDPIAILTRAEHAAFGEAGCGINWKTTERRPSTDGGAGSVETVYRGDTCNCQAWVRKNAAGQVIGLGLRSAC